MHWESWKNFFSSSRVSVGLEFRTQCTVHTHTNTHRDEIQCEIVSTSQSQSRLFTVMTVMLVIEHNLGTWFESLSYPAFLSCTLKKHSFRVDNPLPLHKFWHLQAFIYLVCICWHKYAVWNHNAFDGNEKAEYLSFISLSKTDKMLFVWDVSCVLINRVIFFC